MRSAPLVALERAEQLRADLRADREDVALGGLDRALELAAHRADLRPRERSARERKRPAGIGLAGVHGLAHRERDDAIAVKAGGQGVAHAADRLRELLPLALDLLDLRLELQRTCC